VTACLLVTGLTLVVPHANATAPCAMGVTKTLRSSTAFAGGAVMKRYVASVDDPATTKYDQTARVILSVFPTGVSPHLMHVRLGSRVITGDQVQAQYPSALAGINGDFFVEPTIRGKSVKLARGPMIEAGKVIRGNHHRMHVVGVTLRGKPFGGTVSVRGSVKLGTNIALPLKGVNWETVGTGGVTVYTPDWNSTSSTPRPAGAAEWVIDANNAIKQVRTSTLNADKLGASVAVGTRVVAFSSDTKDAAALGKTGNVVALPIRQNTSTGVTLRTAVGRGLSLVENGLAAPLDCASYAQAARPRTIIGWTSTGTWRVVTVPGKEFVGVGLRVGGFGMAQIANIAKRLGLVNAYEIDGGGSTTLYTRSSTTWTRRDLWRVTGGTYERAVPNGLAFTID